MTVRVYSVDGFSPCTQCGDDYNEHRRCSQRQGLRVLCNGEHVRCVHNPEPVADGEDSR